MSSFNPARVLPGCAATSHRPLPLTRDMAFPWILTRLVAALLLLSSAAGLLYGPHGLYDQRAAMFPALLGQDAVALLFGIPLLLGSAWLARRGSVRALLSWMGVLFYVAYFWYFYVIGIRFTLLFPLHIALVSMSMYGALYLLFALDMTALRARVDSRMPVRLIGGFLMTTALAFAALWLWAIAAALAGGAELDAVSRYVIAIDGVVLLPLSFFCGLWLWSRQTLGYAIAGLLLVKVVATFLTLVSTTVVSVMWGQPADLLQTALYTCGLGVALVLTLRFLRGVSDAPAGAASFG